MARSTHVFDLIIVGGGTAGLSALKEARRHSQNVLLVHDGPEGTTCARTGCMPSKALIHAASLFHGRHKMEAAGIRGAENLTADIPDILNRVRGKREEFVTAVRRDMRALEQCIKIGRAHV